MGLNVFEKNPTFIKFSNLVLLFSVNLFVFGPSESQVSFTSVYENIFFVTLVFHVRNDLNRGGYKDVEEDKP